MKEYLSQHKIAYVNREINSDPAAFSELQKLGFQTAPVTVFGGKAVAGFEPQQLDELLRDVPASTSH